ncbi:hypothetical protein ZWY2020_029090 [Hordeum vulgare]|nr:hypothetical protein ZWY2020_029090 [Hordeum vulgare]
MHNLRINIIYHLLTSQTQNKRLDSMAQFVLGLTKTAVEGTLIRVRSAMEEEALKVQVQQDLVFITAEFQMMHSILNTTNGERANDEVVRTWVRHLRDLAFDVEDCVDAGCDLGNTPILGKAYRDPKICKKFKNRAWVKLMHPFNPDEFRKSLVAQFYPDEHQVNGPMKQVIKENYLIILEEVCTMVEWDAIIKYLPESKNGSRIVVLTRQLWIALMCTGEPYQVSELRRYSDGHSLCAFFKKEDGLHLRVGDCWCWEISSCQNHLLQRNSQAKKKKNDFVMFSWVDVPDQFNLTDLSRQLLLDFHSDDLHTKESAAIGIMEGQDPIQECRKVLCQDKCLVVFDGLRSTHDWDLIKDALLREFHTTKSSIVIITNEKNVAKHVIRHVPASEVLNVKCLQADAAHSLFREVAPKNIKNASPEDMARLSQLILAKSGALPKVIAALCKQLESESTNMWYAWNMLENYTILDSLKGLFSWMQSYFDACSDSLKPCIFYLSVFPIGQDIRRRRLVTRWIAEGYSRDRFGNTSEDWESSKDRYGNTADENGEKFVSNLIEFSIIQQLTTRNVCQVNGFFHGYIISRPMEDNLVFSLEGFCKPNSQRTGQHLTIRKTWHRDINVYDSIDFTRLRSLTVFGEWKSFLISYKMKRLRVLDLEDTSGVTDEHLKHIVKLVTRLKFLSIRRCRGISRLPDSINGLRQLQTLDVRHTFIVMLPPDICKLPRLQYIHAGRTEPWYEGDGTITIQSAPDEDQITAPQQDIDITPTILPPPPSEADNVGVEVPIGIGNLTVLHTLGVVDVCSAGGKALLEELEHGKLAQLRKLKVSGINRGNIHHFFSVVSRHRHLLSLSVRLDEDVQHDITLPGPPRKSLRKMKLYGDVVNLPVWINRFNTLKCLDIDMTITKGEDLLPLEELVKKGILRRLCAKLIQDGDLHLSMPNEQSINFQNLKIECRSKVNVTFGESKLVKVLMVRCFSGSDLHFSGLEKLEYLEEVWLIGAYGKTLKQEVQHQLSKHRKEEKPVLKLVRPRS